MVVLPQNNYTEILTVPQLPHVVAQLPKELLVSLLKMACAKVPVQVPRHVPVPRYVDVPVEQIQEVQVPRQVPPPCLNSTQRVFPRIFKL